MTKYYAYTRVSTLKQGEKGVSLQEQRAAIELYAARNNLQIVEWFEERLTAAKRGRPLFVRMLKGLSRGDADGVVIHKIDRSARNLRDWADLGDLIDSGVAVHFANESLDLLSRGGRLSADIQAVVASDYIRNLSEETRKGMYGRLKQGYYPFRAPLGYVDTGSGRPKEIDAGRGPLVRQAFQLYATGRYSFDPLLEELTKRGLRSRSGLPLTINSLSRILNNPFYAGLIRLRTTGETYQGKHTALVPMQLFQTVRARLAGKFQVNKRTHDFTLRGLFRCTLCGRSLIGETQKGHVYYRCHTKRCPTKTFREEVLEDAMLRSWTPFAPTTEWKHKLLRLLKQILEQDHQISDTIQTSIRVQVERVTMRMNALVDALLDGVLDKESFENRRLALLEERQSLEHSLRSQAATPTETIRFTVEALELALSAQQSYRCANNEARRELAIRLCSNRSVAYKKVSVEPYFPFHILEKRQPVSDGVPDEGTSRTPEVVAKDLWNWGKQEMERLKARAAGS